LIAALYVETNGVYYGLPDVDPWDKERDALLYDGPWPVVAHPPCASWSLMGNCRPEVRARGDGGTFAHALDAVRTFGGVLEQPAHSRAWDAFNLPAPLVVEGWTGGLCGGWSAYVEQSRYGYPLRKPTWLYCYGLDPPPLRWGRTLEVPEDQKAWWHGASARGREGTLWSSNHNTAKASKTPLVFRDALLDMARSVELHHTATR
jgi:hypothetical protein